MKIESHCINLCQLDSRGVCLGCFRTLDEIARWKQMDEAQRRAIIAALGKRKPTSIPAKSND